MGAQGNIRQPAGRLRRAVQTSADDMRVSPETDQQRTPCQAICLGHAVRVFQAVSRAGLSAARVQSALPDGLVALVLGTVMARWT